MKKNLRHKFLIGLMLTTSLLGVASTPVFAASNAVSLTPPSGSSKPGDKFTISVDGTVGSYWLGTYSVSGSIDFPAKLLKVVSVDASGSSFTVNSTVTPDNTAGTISFSQSNNWWQGVNNQNVHLFAVTFQSLANGTAPVSLTNVQYNSGAAAMSGGTYKIATPASPKPSPKPTPSSKPKPHKSPTPPKSTSPTPTPTPEVTKTPAPTSESDGGLKIENVKVTTTRQENSIAWSLNNTKATPSVLYGTSQGNQSTPADVTKQDDGTYITELTGLKLGTPYYFTIKAATADNLLGATYSGVLTTRGYPVQLTIEQNNLLIPGARVVIGERGFDANKDSIISAELGDGDYTAKITPPGSSDTYSAQFTVKQQPIPVEGEPQLQTFTLNITTVGSSSGSKSSLIPKIIGGAVIMIAVIGGAIGLFVMRRKNMLATSNVVDSDLLTSSYGESVVEHRTNTPQPNLEASVPAPPVPTAEIEASQSAQDLPVEQPAAAESSPIPSSFDPAQPPPPPLPLPPVLNTDPSLDNQQAEAEITTAPAIEEPDENADLAADVSRVESSEQVSDEPSAVYDAATGELAIIHHHASEATVGQAQETQPQIYNNPIEPALDEQPSAEEVATPQETTAQTSLTPTQSAPSLHNVNPVDTPAGSNIVTGSTPLTTEPR